MHTEEQPLAATRHAPDKAGQLDLNAIQRLATLTGGGFLLGRGLRAGGLFGCLQMIVGGLAMASGASGRCPGKRAMQPTLLEKQLSDAHQWNSAKALSRSITVNRPREALYRYWRDFSHMPTFMDFVERVEVIDEQRSHWVARLPLLDRTYEWHSLVTEDIPGERLAWEAEAGAPVRNLGWVTFRDAPNGAGTEIQAVIAHEVPGGQLGYTLASGFSKVSGFKAGQDLRRFKQLMETGEIATNQMTREPAAKHTGIAATGEAR